MSILKNIVSDNNRNAIAAQINKHDSNILFQLIPNVFAY